MKILGYLTLATLAAGILLNLSDIRRYVHMTMM